MDDKSVIENLRRETKSIMTDPGFTASEKIVMAMHAGYNLGFQAGVEMQKEHVLEQGYDFGYASALMDLGVEEDD